MSSLSFTDNTQIVVEEQPSGTRELLLKLNGQRVSRIVIIPMLMRIGTAVLRMDGIGGVETNEEVRNRGFSRRLMETAVERMTAGDASLSTLFGIQDFYQKFGYDTTGPEFTVSLPVVEEGSTPISLPPGWRFRPLAEADLPSLMRLYHANTRSATGALVRNDNGDDPAETERLLICDPNARKIGLRAWNRLLNLITEPGEDACRVLLDPAGEIAAYAWCGDRNWWMFVRRRDQPDAFHLAEAMAGDATAADALLAACRLWATEAGEHSKEVAFAIPPQGPLAAAATYQGGSISAVYTRGGDFMGRVLNLERLIEQMLPEFSALARNTPLSFHGRLTFETELGSASLHLGPAGASPDGATGTDRLIVSLPQAVLARLCLGGFDPGDVLARLPDPPEPRVHPLLLTLFPQRHPHIYPMDRF